MDLNSRVYSFVALTILFLTVLFLEIPGNIGYFDNYVTKHYFGSYSCVYLLGIYLFTWIYEVFTLSIAAFSIKEALLKV